MTRQLKKELWPSKVVIKDLTINYYTVSKRITEMETWLGENLGCFKSQWNVIHRYDGADFYFRRDEDATFFSLRWS